MSLEPKSLDARNVWRFETSFSSVPGGGASFIDAVVDALERRDWPSNDLFAVRLALEEAIANAVEHGNRRDASKSVFVAAELDEKRVLLSVRDEGPGFDFSEAPNPLLEENLEKPSGRGIFLINSFMSKVWRNASGNEIYMEKTPS